MGRARFKLIRRGRKKPEQYMRRGGATQAELGGANYKRGEVRGRVSSYCRKGLVLLQALTFPSCFLVGSKERAQCGKNPEIMTPTLLAQRVRSASRETPKEKDEHN